MRLFHRSVVLGAVSAAALVAATAAQAGSFAIREQSTSAQGLSFAGAASGSGSLSSIFWNPAMITAIPGWQSEWHAALIIPESEINPTFPTRTIGFGASGDIGQDALVPASYSSYQINERLWVGLASSSPYGLITDPRTNWSGQVYSRSSKIFSINVNPIVGYKVNDWLSVGAGPSVQYFDVRLKRAVGVTPNAPSAILDGDDYGFGFTAGLSLTPFAGTTIGIGYRSLIDHKLDGSLTTPLSAVPVTAKLTLPDQVTVGISQVITPDFKVHAGFEWTNWSRLGNAPVVGPAGPINSAEIRLNYEDGFLYSLGAEYRVLPALTLRAGVAYEKSPIDTEVRSTRLPDDDRVWASIGATYAWNDRISFDLAYTHIFAANDTKIAITPGQQDYAGVNFLADVDSNVNIISGAVRYRWDTPVVAVVPAAAPIVRKY